MQKGVLMKWNDAKGFGFILPEDATDDVFMHISSLRGSERRPMVGDVLYFNVVRDEQGRKRAVNVNIRGVESVFTERSRRHRRIDKQPKSSSRPHTAPPRPPNRSHGIAKLISSIALVLAVAVGYRFYNNDPRTEVPFSTANATVAVQFQCAGKTRCNQMTSCEEAMFYLRHCPGSVTDGDGDGRPCEDQWCGH
jgi:cold shock CspA family protein